MKKACGLSLISLIFMMACAPAKLGLNLIPKESGFVLRVNPLKVRETPTYLRFSKDLKLTAQFIHHGFLDGLLKISLKKIEQIYTYERLSKDLTRETGIIIYGDFAELTVADILNYCKPKGSTYRGYKFYELKEGFQGVKMNDNTLIIGTPDAIMKMIKIYDGERKSFLENQYANSFIKYIQKKDHLWAYARPLQLGYFPLLSPLYKFMKKEPQVLEKELINYITAITYEFDLTNGLYFRILYHGTEKGINLIADICARYLSEETKEAVLKESGLADHFGNIVVKKERYLLSLTAIYSEKDIAALIRKFKNILAGATNEPRPKEIIIRGK